MIQPALAFDAVRPAAPIRLRPYQAKAIASIYDYFDDHDGNPLVVIPTAGGKSLIIADFLRSAFQSYADTRVQVVTHVKELIEQNHAELLDWWPDAPAGIYSAGVGRRDVEHPILFNGIQSVYNKVFDPKHYDLQRCDLLLIDEAHLVPKEGEGMYLRYIRDLRTCNPNLKVVGFTATHYRLDSGLLTDGETRVFTDVCYEASILDLVRQGYLAPLRSKRTDTLQNVTGVGTRGGEFIAGELERAVDIDSVNKAAVAEIVAAGADRKSWLLFCSGITHADHIAEIVRSYGITCATISHLTPKTERAEIIRDFKALRIRAVASMNVLTTGFNARAVDLLAMLRPTKSTGLYVQMAGRGSRLSPETGKRDCLVLDFAGNVARHGPVDSVVPQVKRSTGTGQAPTKTCPECSEIVAASARECPGCGYMWPEREIKITPKADPTPIMQLDEPDWLNVQDIRYSKHVSRRRDDAKPTLMVEYLARSKPYREWVCFEHNGMARRRAVAWWLQRCPVGLAVPSTIAEALTSVDKLRVPAHIAVRRRDKYHDIVRYHFEDE